MKATEEQIKHYLGLFKILFSEEEIKNIKEGEDKAFTKTVIDKIDKFLAETFKEIKMKDKCNTITIYYVLKNKKMAKVKKIPLDKEDYETLYNPKFQDKHKNIFEKHLELLSTDDKKSGYYIGVFENVKGETVKSVAGTVR